MPLNSYLKRTHMTIADFAKWFNLSVSFARKLSTGERTPTLDLMMQIEKKSEGAMGYPQWCQLRSRYLTRQARNAAKEGSGGDTAHFTGRVE